MANGSWLTLSGSPISAATRPEYIGRPIRPRMSPRATGWPKKFTEAGLDPVIDGIGNVIGHNPRASRRLLVGSHSETQPHGGWLDGALGVIYALELARAFAADPALCRARHRADRLGRRGGPFRQHARQPVLHRHVAGEAKSSPAAAATGCRCAPALAEAGFAGRPRERLDPTRYVGYLEAHIEQGDWLDSTGLKIGIVEAIIGNWNYWVTITGQQNHAGHDADGAAQGCWRRDGAARLAYPTTASPRSPGPRTVWTLGPHAARPERAEHRPRPRRDAGSSSADTDTSILGEFENALLELVSEFDKAGPCRIAIEPMSKSEPAAMDPGFQASDRERGRTPRVGHASADAERRRP